MKYSTSQLKLSLQIEPGLGAVINRLNSTIDNLVAQSSNTEIAKGRIMDADFTRNGKVGKIPSA